MMKKATQLSGFYYFVFPNRSPFEKTVFFLVIYYINFDFSFTIFLNFSPLSLAKFLFIIE